MAIAYTETRGIVLKLERRFAAPRERVFDAGGIEAVVVSSRMATGPIGGGPTRQRCLSPRDATNSRWLDCRGARPLPGSAAPRTPRVHLAMDRGAQRYVRVACDGRISR